LKGRTEDAFSLLSVSAVAMQLRDIRLANTGFPWRWAAVTYALNFAVIWMASYITDCAAPETAYRGCESAGMASHVLSLVMIGLAVSFPAMLTLVTAVWLGRGSLNAFYLIGISAIAFVSLILYRSGVFIPQGNSCPACNLAFLIQCGFNLLWLFVLFPAGLVYLHGKSQTPPRRS
jgi:hypothetical protein